VAVLRWLSVEGLGKKKKRKNLKEHGGKGNRNLKKKKASTC
jgi:hypothetical protein